MRFHDMDILFLHRLVICSNCERSQFGKAETRGSLPQRPPAFVLHIAKIMKRAAAD
jgi:hypothetical protein